MVVASWRASGEEGAGEGRVEAVMGRHCTPGAVGAQVEIAQAFEHGGQVRQGDLVADDQPRVDMAPVCQVGDGVEIAQGIADEELHGDALVCGECGHQRVRLGAEAEADDFAVEREQLAELEHSQQDKLQAIARLQQEVQDRKKTQELQQQKIQQLQQEAAEHAEQLSAQQQQLQQQLAEAQQQVSESQQQLAALHQQSGDLGSDLTKLQADYVNLTEQHQQTQQKSQKLEAQLEHAQNRQFAAEQKQQQEADNSRELIRTLRTELQQQQETHQAQVQALEERMMEFKLKFEYAQKQLQVTG